MLIVGKKHLPKDDHGESREEQDRLSLIGKKCDPRYVDAKRICGLARWRMSEQMIYAHRVSDLVIRQRKTGEYVLSAFIYFFTLQQVNSSTFPRPSQWLELDFVSGKILDRHSCLDEDFSPATFCQKFDLTLAEEVDVSEQYYRATYNILDEVRIGYMQSGEIDLERYAEYLQAVKHNIPVCYHQFVDDLSIPVPKISAPG